MLQNIKYILFVLVSFLSTFHVVSQNSPLASGTWHKLEIRETGVYKLDYSLLSQIGISNPEKIQVYGYGGLLPQPNSSFRHGDIVENAVFVNGEDNGILDPDDYVLFFAQGPNPIHIGGSSITSSVNPYASSSFYFITEGTDDGRRIENIAANTSGTQSYSSLPYLYHHEVDEENIAGSGRTWLGESFRFKDVREWNFGLTDLLNDSTVSVNVTYAGGSADFKVKFNTYINNELKKSSFTPTQVEAGYGVKLYNVIHNIDLNLPSDNIGVKSQFFNQGDFGASGFLDKISINYWRELKGDKSTFLPIPSNYDNSNLNISNVSSSTMLWNVTDITSVQSLEMSSGVAFIGNASQLMIVNKNDTKSVQYLGEVANQNLHGLSAPELLIITNRVFTETASQYREFKVNEQGISTEVIYVDDIYNEFSSGSQDISAIRDFIKHVYDSGSGLKHVLLLGDCSYDYKDRIANNTNYVPIYESYQSFDNILSYSSDDYYGFLDNDEGEWNEVGTANERLDIGVGRIPITSNTQGNEYLNKLRNYTRSSTSLGNWRNDVLFVADDEDSNLHMRHANEISTDLEEMEPSINVNRLFLDAYEQISSSGGQVAPSVNEQFDRRMDRGALIVNFSGHGSEEQWTQEEILTFTQIQGYDNFEKLPFFITATCEFGRYDNPKLEAGAERLIMNANGGAIGLMTTTRPVYATSNKTINEQFYEQAFVRDVDSTHKMLGDILMGTKNNSVSGVFNRNFALLGDPSMRLAYPDYKISLDSLNGREVSGEDTIRALQKVEFAGRILLPNGTYDSTFNGSLRLRMYDKVSELSTIGPGDEVAFQYKQLSSVIFEGDVEVIKGIYQVDFVIPKDISYTFGTGKMSFYATSSDGRDASGSYNDIVVGGGINGFVDDSAPKVLLYMDDETFVSGGIVGSTPVFIAKIEDENGINTTNTGIGHEMTLIIDDNRENIEVLNDFYTSVDNTFKKGEIRFPMSSLSEGEHKLTFKVWDVNNNSTEVVIYLVVSQEGKIEAYPNPFSDEVTFYIDQPRQDIGGTVEIRVFDRTGRELWEQTSEFDEFTSVIESVKWDGHKQSGENLENGIYFIQATLRYSDNEGDLVKKSKVILQK